MEYNSQRPKMIIPEYGRNVQKMINRLLAIEDRDRRSVVAEAVVNIMAQVNPQSKDVLDYRQTLWDHLHIIAEYKLDVDSPYDKPKQEIIEAKPERVAYAEGNIRFPHYGKNIQKLITEAIEMEEGEMKNEVIRLIANHMKKNYINWNKDSVEDKVIFNHLRLISNDKIIIDENITLEETKDILARNRRPSNKRNQQRSNNQKGNYSNRRKRRN